MRRLLGLGARRLALVVVAHAFALGVVEVVVRLAVPVSDALLVPDPVLGYRHRPGRHRWVSREFDVMVSVNSHGFRDRERSVGAGVAPRVAVLGDSIVEALQVPDEATFTAALERVLGVEVLNFGMSGYGPAQAWRLFDHEARHYGARAVVYVFFTENDVRNSVAVLDGQPLLPYPRAGGDDLEFDPPASPSAVKTALGRWSATYRWGQRDIWPHVVAWRTARGGSRPAPESPVWDSAWQLTERALVALHRSALGENARFLVAVVPPLTDTTATERRLAEILVRREIPFVSLVAALRTTPGTYFAADGHLTPVGHATVARHLGPALETAVRATR